MAKLNAQKLFDLIKSMTKAEKKAFTMLANMSSGNRTPLYLKLFEAIDSIDEYNDLILYRKVRKKIKNEASIAPMKSKLHDKILQSLRFYHDNTKDETIDLQIQNLLINVELLNKKQLREQAKESLTKAKKLMLEHQSYYWAPKIYYWEKTLYYMTADFDKMVAEEEDIFQRLLNSIGYTEEEGKA